MAKTNLVRKLTSRKLWLSIASFVSMLMMAQGKAESEAAQVAALIMAGATVIGYAIAEGLADAGHADDGTTCIGFMCEDDASTEEEK